MEKLYVVGDIHGCYKTLLALIKKLPKKEKSKVCFVGDLIDRGSNSKDVIELVKTNNYDCVIDNHELFFIDYVPKILRDEIDEETKQWLFKYGGKETLKSYLLENSELDKELLAGHIEYLKSLPNYIEYKDLKTKDNRYLVVSHSNVANTWQFKDYPKDSLEYEQFFKTIHFGRFKNYDNKDIYNVFGHTPVDKVDIENGYKTNIDTGCVYDNGINLKGYLSALEYPSLRVVKQKNIENEGEE
jgi:serine/threonine protein phosphatase 1